MTAFEPAERWSDADVAAFLEMDDDAFRAWSQGSPVKRAGYEGLARNAAIVLGNRGDALHLPVLDRTQRQHPSDVVRDAAEWAGRALRRRLAEPE